ncbi:MAG: NapC/NirT family cytochrome c [Desulfobacterales bacterium]|nr:NapC/NirT family cytochrome c [Desulfobacterales bacterium]
MLSFKFRILLVGMIIGMCIIASLGFGMKISDQRQFCSSCHIMKEAALTHKMSLHATISCNDCHAPHNLVNKIPFKVHAGTKDIYLNIFGKLEEPIHAGVNTKQVVNTNCKNCHTMTNSTVNSIDVKPFCTDCHRNVQHMRMKPISIRKVADA